MNGNQESKIIVCPNCKGAGKVYRMNKNGTPYVSKGQPQMIECEYCNGERVVIERTTVEHFILNPTIVEEEQKKGGLFGWMKK